MESYARFSDENYKNWLKTAESLYILRKHIRVFVENETETYHKSLQERLKGEICENNCTIKKNAKKFNLCVKCEQWKEEILANHLMNVGIHWDNCYPHLWHSEKWEVAKAYMPRTPRDNRSFNEFDITAILNFMDHCQHFRKIIKSPFLNKVIQVRNKVMHSPELRLSKKDMDENIVNVVKLAKILEPHAPGLKATLEEIQQFQKSLDKYCGQRSLHAEDSKEENLKLLNREHQSLKEKIEFLTQHYDEQSKADLQKELQGMKSFLDQNKDLLENLDPHIKQLDEIYDKVNRHDQQIDNLENRVDKLEKETQDPVLIGKPVKFKNHLLEEAKKRKWPDPIFTEVIEADGYRGRVKVNEEMFIGSHVCNNKKSAHQDVAKKALDSLKLYHDSTEELSHLGCIGEPSTSSAIPTGTPETNAMFYATATVVLKNQEVVSDGCAHKEHAIESAYKKLACLFGLNAQEECSSYKAVVLEYFDSCNYPPPSEHLDQHDDKNFCKLLLCGPFTFHDKDGSIKKKQAEQQVAMVALQQLSVILNCSPEAVSDGNYKGFLKERLDALGLKQPNYSTERKEGISEEVEGPSTSGDNSHPHCTRVVSKKARLQPEDSASTQPPPTPCPVDHDVHLTETQDTQTPLVPGKMGKLDYTEITTVLQAYNLNLPSVIVESVSSEQKFVIRVEVFLDNLTFKNEHSCTSKKDAIREAYHSLGCALGIFKSNTVSVQDATMLVKQDFLQKYFPHPKEVIEGNMGPFCCSLTDISFHVVYEGEGATEADAKCDGLQKALHALPSLFGFKCLPSSGSAEEMEDQINIILRKNGQKDLTCSLQQSRHMISIKLQFTNYTMKSMSEGNRKANRNNLSRRILGLLGEKTEANSAVRNCLDEWFIKRSLQSPAFEDIGSVGSLAMFSVPLLCSHSDWEDSSKAANEKLIDELKKRFIYLTEQD